MDPKVESHRILPQDSDLFMSEKIAVYFLQHGAPRLCVSVCVSLNVYGMVQI